jgi:hypothetical protein
VHVVKNGLVLVSISGFTKCRGIVLKSEYVFKNGGGRNREGEEREEGDAGRRKVRRRNVGGRRQEGDKKTRMARRLEDEERGRREGEGREKRGRREGEGRIIFRTSTCRTASRSGFLTAFSPVKEFNLANQPGKTFWKFPTSEVFVRT